ncbi:MAG: putative protein N(5)-glutamine methyltransferase [Microbacteriaceae bacterium]
MIRSSSGEFGGAGTLAAVTRRLRSAGCVFAEDEAALLIDAASDPRDLERMVQRREAGEPLEPLLGWVRFLGSRVSIGSGVFVPRRRTEYLARRVIRLAGSDDIVLDLCCGAGAVGAALLAERPGAQLWASDLEPAAVHWARRNLDPVGGHVVQGDLFEALPTSLLGRFNVIAANAPYVPTADIDLLPREARQFEPRAALDGGEDGLDLHRRICAEAVPWLAPGGYLLIETSTRQAVATAALMLAAGLRTRVVRSGRLEATVAIGSGC